jgi:hypothetical protein
MGDEFCGGRAESNSFSLVGQSNFPIRWLSGSAWAISCCSSPRYPNTAIITCKHLRWSSAILHFDYKYTDKVFSVALFIHWFDKYKSWLLMTKTTREGGQSYIASNFLNLYLLHQSVNYLKRSFD